jgi:segregation and condensation protein A
MAATLMEIKSRLLLPKGQHAVDPNAEDEEVDPRWELVHQLLQYKKFKEAAATLAGLVETRQNLMARHVSTLSNEEADRPLKGVDRIELWNTFNIVLRRLAEKLVVGEIHDEQVTVADQMEWLLGRTRETRTFVFSQLFPEGVTLRRLVATFLAMLELTRLKRLRIRQSEAFADIVAEAVIEGAPAPGGEDAAVPAAVAEPNVAPPATPAPPVAPESAVASPAETAAAPAADPDAAPVAPVSAVAAEVPAAPDVAVTPDVVTQPPPALASEADVAAPAETAEKPLETPPVPPTVSP